MKQDTPLYFIGDIHNSLPSNAKTRAIAEMLAPYEHTIIPEGDIPTFVAAVTSRINALNEQYPRSKPISANYIECNYTTAQPVLSISPDGSDRGLYFRFTRIRRRGTASL